MTAGAHAGSTYELAVGARRGLWRATAEIKQPASVSGPNTAKTFNVVLHNITAFQVVYSLLSNIVRLFFRSGL
jgi:hypothetical protein